MIFETRVKKEQPEMVSNCRSGNKEGWNAYQRQYQRNRTKQMKKLKETHEKLKALGLLNEDNELDIQKLEKCYVLDKENKTLTNLLSNVTIVVDCYTPGGENNE